MAYLWRAVDHEGKVRKVFAKKHRTRGVALKFLKRTIYGVRDVTDNSTCDMCTPS